jgi:hypothetical protein
MTTCTARHTSAKCAELMAEPIAVPIKQHNFFPRAFVWRGERHDVRAVEACRTETRRGWRGVITHHRFRVRTDVGWFELVQDAARDLWHLERR